MEGNYRSVKDVAEEWGLTVRRVQMLCTSGKLPGAKKVGNLWMIPEGTVRPQDNRMVSGEYKKAVFKAAVRTQSYNDYMSFLSAMSYGIRTSLNTIMGYSDLIKTHSDDPARVIEFAENIKQSGKGILVLIDNSVEYTKLRNNEVEFREDICNLEDIVNRLIEDADADAVRHNISIMRRINLKHEFVKADVEKVSCILGNVIENAVRYSKKDGMVSVRAVEMPEKEPGICTVNFSIIDNGIGMSPLFIERVFDGYSYEKELDSVRLINHGSGLGLAIVKELLNLMGGSININSQLDFGTKVDISIPFKVADLSEISAGNVETPDLKEYKGKRLLLAEDNELNRDIEMGILEEAGFEVDWAGDGIICVADLERAQDNYYDMVLMDIQMPNMNGVTATQVIRGLDNESKANIPIVAMTASVLKEDRERALKAGMSGFVEKPLDIKNLLKVMKNLNI